MRLPDFVKVYSGPDGRVNSTVIVGQKGTVVVDTQVTLSGGKAVKDLAVEVSEGKPIVAVLLTHEHFDHIAGNQFFGCPIVSTEPARQSIVSMDSGSFPEGYVHTPPTVTFSEETTLYLGDTSLRLKRDGGHCPGQCSVFILEHGVLLTGDNVFHGRTPYVSSADVPAWVQVLTGLHAMNPEIVIPGHGAPGTKAILLEQRDWLESFLGLSQASAKAGLSVEEAADKIITALKGDPSRRQVVIMGVSRIYRSMGV